MLTIFVTGASGVIGRATLPRLVAAGHTVRALSRSAANDELIRNLGAEPVRGDLFAPDSLLQAMTGADAVMHLATRIPPVSRARQREGWRENDRIRAEGARNLVDAALKTGVRVFVYPSFAFVYPNSGNAWIDAAATPTAPVDILESTLAAEREVARFAAAGEAGSDRGVALRLGALYGEDVSSLTEQLRLARWGISPLAGAGDSYFPALWIDDAATALVAALERAPSGVYDVVDDEPLPLREVNAALAAVVGRGRLFVPPARLVRLLGGPIGDLFTRSLRISNRRFREATGWRPAAPNLRQGLARIIAAHPVPERLWVPFAVRAGLWAMLLFSLGAGLWQQFAPRLFYDDFPGFGMRWVSVDGPYNEHLLRDLGGASLALAVVIAFALARPSVGLVRAVAAGFLVSQGPHFIYHAAHLDLLSTDLDRVLQTLSLTLTVLIPAVVLVAANGIAATSAKEATPLAAESTGSQRGRPQLIASTR